MSELTREQAIALGKTNWWHGKPAREIVRFQLFEPLLCMDFSDYHKALEDALGRPVWTHELANAERLQKEFLHDLPPPTFEEILSIIPEDKRIVCVVPPAVPEERREG